MDQTATTRFGRLCLITLVAVYFLVWVGGMVRATGSGMGCPDWPKCFGSWVPPTSVDQLPEDYKSHYAAYREKKNVRFASFLRSVGMTETADKLQQDKSVLVEADFNPAKTWVEYANRLVGAAAGLLIIALCVASYRIRHSHPWLFRASLATLIVVLIQGWFGSIVVSTNLTPWTVTIHMLMALMVVGLLVWMLHEASGREPIPAGNWRYGLLLAAGALLVQVLLGTRVRETLDVLAATVARSEWIGASGASFLVHRSFSWAVLMIQLVVWNRLRTTGVEKTLVHGSFLLILASVLTGVVMAYGGVPALVQPVHLTLAILTFGVYLQIYFRLSAREEKAIV